MDVEGLLKKYGLFWQYPVITEEICYQQEKNNPTYIGFPWATIIDKRCDLNAIFKILKDTLGSDIFNLCEYSTCCQHIDFRKLTLLWQSLNITTIYTPHKCIGEDIIGKIKLKPCPLYAVNIEDPERNRLFLNQDFINRERKYLYSFIGGHQKNYISDIRHAIFNLDHPPTTLIKNTGEWHFNAVVYDPKQNSCGELNQSSTHQTKTETYNQILLDSRYTLAPSGAGPNSIRFWEALAVGSIPILLSDKLELPEHPLWNQAIIRLPESELKKLTEYLSRIDMDEEHIRRQNCVKIYQDFQNTFISN